jgi:anaerobic selenocysteine-containing dehydrogenase
MDRVLQSWGVDGHNSHTNVCSAAARLGYALWSGADRPAPDHENSKFMLLLSSHLETGHYFNPHAQRIIDGKMKGAKLAVIDVRLSNTASMADYWMAPWPGTEAMLLLAMAHVILEERLFDAKFMEDWVNWRDFLDAMAPSAPKTFESFVTELRRNAASRPRRSSRSRAASATRRGPSLRTSGATRHRATKAAGRSHAASSSCACSSVRSALPAGPT